MVIVTMAAKGRTCPRTFTATRNLHIVLSPLGLAPDAISHPTQSSKAAYWPSPIIPDQGFGAAAAAAAVAALLAVADAVVAALEAAFDTAEAVFVVAAATGVAAGAGITTAATVGL